MKTSWISVASAAILVAGCNGGSTVADTGVVTDTGTGTDAVVAADTGTATDVSTSNDASDTGTTTAESLNGCGGSGTAFMDMTGTASPSITTVGTTYSPPCVLIHTGQSVTIAGSSTHPLVGGAAPSLSGQTDGAGNPIPAGPSTSPVNVAFPTAGTYGFYCAVHQSIGMYGAIKVQ